jgi:hypothetical protein
MKPSRNSKSCCSNFFWGWFTPFLLGFGQKRGGKTGLFAGCYAQTQGFSAELIATFLGSIILPLFLDLF